MHGGRLSAYSEGEGKGSCFNLCLPLTKGTTSRTPSMTIPPTSTHTDTVINSNPASSEIIAAVSDASSSSAPSSASLFNKTQQQSDNTHLGLDLVGDEDKIIVQNTTTTTINHNANTTSVTTTTPTFNTSGEEAKEDKSIQMINKVIGTEFIPSDVRSNATSVNSTLHSPVSGDSAARTRSRSESQSLISQSEGSSKVRFTHDTEVSMSTPPFKQYLKSSMSKTSPGKFPNRPRYFTEQYLGITGGSAAADSYLSSPIPSYISSNDVSHKKRKEIQYLKFLVVDDSIANRKMMVKALNMEFNLENGFELYMEEAENGQICLDKVLPYLQQPPQQTQTDNNRPVIRTSINRCRSQQSHMSYSISTAADRSMINKTKLFDAVLMDVNMPVMDGVTATKRLRDAGFTGAIFASKCLFLFTYI